MRDVTCGCTARVVAAKEDVDGITTLVRGCR